MRGDLRAGLTPGLGALDLTPESIHFFGGRLILAGQIPGETNRLRHLRQGRKRREHAINRHLRGANQCAEIRPRVVRNQQQVGVEPQHALGIGGNRRPESLHFPVDVADVRQVRALADRHHAIRRRHRIHVLVNRPVLRHNASRGPRHAHRKIVAIHGLRAGTPAGPSRIAVFPCAGARSIDLQSRVGRDKVLHGRGDCAYQNGQHNRRREAAQLHHARDQRGPLLPLISRSELLAPAPNSTFRAKSHSKSERRFK